MPRPSKPAAEFVLSLLGPHPRPPESVDWPEVEGLLAMHGLQGLAVGAGLRNPGLLPDAVQERLLPAYRAAELTTTLLMETGRQARTVLREAGIPSLFFKGAALVGAGVYEHAGSRRMDDVDLLVRPEHARSSASLLERAGFMPWTPWEEGREEWLDSFSFVGPESPGGLPLALDLHWRVGYGDLRFGGSKGEAILWEGARAVEGIPAPGRHLIVVLEHVLKHLRFQVHFPGIADVSALATAVRDWDDFMAVAGERRQAPALGLLLDLFREDVGLQVPPQVLSVLRGDGVWMEGARVLVRPRRLLGRERPVRGRAWGIMLRWLLAGSPWRAAKDMARAAFPEDRWLRARYGPKGRDGVEAATSTLRLRLRYAADVLRWLTYRGRSPASPNQSFFDRRAKW